MRYPAWDPDTAPDSTSAIFRKLQRSCCRHTERLLRSKVFSPLETLVKMHNRSNDKKVCAAGTTNAQRIILESCHILDSRRIHQC